MVERESNPLLENSSGPRKELAAASAQTVPLYEYLGSLVATAVGDEGGFAPNLKSNAEAIRVAKYNRLLRIERELGHERAAFFRFRT
jgi:enolase